MKKYIFLILMILLSFAFVGVMFATSTPPDDIGFGGTYPDGTIVASGDATIIDVLSFIQSLLLKLVLPIVVVGGSLYIAYELFTAEGDESKMKKAWKSATFTGIGLVCIAVSYAFVTIVSSLSL